MRKRRFAFEWARVHAACALDPRSGAAGGRAAIGFTVKLGAGGISPAVSGQRADQNNFTIDGVLNNNIITNVWAISPPPDAIEEFNVQAHITDAQFAISSGANINLVTRSGTNQFHGDLMGVYPQRRFGRADLSRYKAPRLQAKPIRRLFGRSNHQEEYLVFRLLGGISLFPGRYPARCHTYSNQIAGDFSAEEGTTPIGTDSLGRPEYANEIYDPDDQPSRSGKSRIISYEIPSQITSIPSNRLNAASQAFAAKFYPKPNLNVPEGVLPNIETTVPTTIKSDVFGFRLDHQFTAER